MVAWQYVLCRKCFKPLSSVNLNLVLNGYTLLLNLRGLPIETIWHYTTHFTNQLIAGCEKPFLDYVFAHKC